MYPAHAHGCHGGGTLPLQGGRLGVGSDLLAEPPTYPSRLAEQTTAVAD